LQEQERRPSGAASSYCKGRGGSDVVGRRLVRRDRHAGGQRHLGYEDPAFGAVIGGHGPGFLAPRRFWEAFVAHDGAFDRVSQSKCS
jgi:hypothetical protein